MGHHLETAVAKESRRRNSEINHWQYEPICRCLRFGRKPTGSAGRRRHLCCSGCGALSPKQELGSWRHRQWQALFMAVNGLCWKYLPEEVLQIPSLLLSIDERGSMTYWLFYNEYSRQWPSIAEKEKRDALIMCSRISRLVYKLATEVRRLLNK